MADQLTYYRACRIQAAAGSPFRARDVFLEEHDHAAARDEVWTACGVGAYDLVPIPFHAAPAAFAPAATVPPAPRRHPRPNDTAVCRHVPEGR